MIYCNLRGGLGNMLFQIAATKSMAIDLGVECSFPNLINHYHFLNSDNYYNPDLKHSLEYQEMFSNLQYSQQNQPLPLIEFPFEYIKIHPPKDDFIISGYFQSEKYFKHNKEQIIDFLKIPKTIDDYINQKYGNLLKQKTTSIHVRRGDYLKLQNHHPILDIDYYKKSISLLENDTDTFIVFSNDIEWCKNNFGFIDPVYIENEKDYVEIYLMGLCNNNIIANSSFSLWAATMNQNENKKVIAPKNWFGPAITYNTVDVLSEKWIKI